MTQDQGGKKVEDWWFNVSEAERAYFTQLASAAASGFSDPEQLFTYWRADAKTPRAERYIEDLIERVRMSLDDGTHPRIVRLGI